MMLIECGWRAAQWQNKFSYLLSGILPKILDVAPHRNTHDIIYIDDALKANKGHLMLTYIHSAVFRLAHPSICLSVCLSVCHMSTVNSKMENHATFKLRADGRLHASGVTDRAVLKQGAYCVSRWRHTTLSRLVR